MQAKEDLNREHWKCIHYKEATYGCGSICNLLNKYAFSFSCAICKSFQLKKAEAIK